MNASAAAASAAVGTGRAGRGGAVALMGGVAVMSLPFLDEAKYFRLTARRLKKGESPKLSRPVRPGFAIADVLRR